MSVQPIFNVRNLTLVNGGLCGGNVPPFDLGGGIGGPPEDPNQHPYKYWPFVSITKCVMRNNAEGAVEHDYSFWDVRPSDRERENWAIASQCASWLAARMEHDEWPLRDSHLFAKIVEDQLRVAHDPHHRQVIDAFWRCFGDEIEGLLVQYRRAVEDKR
jgi:hypothetical protein